MRSRLAASAKKSNTCSRGSGMLIDVERTWRDTLLIVTVVLRFSWPVPPALEVLLEISHVRCFWTLGVQEHGPLQE